MGPPADPAAKAPAPFAKARLSPEEAERLAATFRPCWELDDAPFTGPGSMTDGQVRDLQGGGTHADVRAAASTAYATNGSHAPPAPTVSHEPEHSVIIDRSLAADDPSRAAQRPAAATVQHSAPVGPTGTVVLPPGVAPRIPPQEARLPPSARRQAVPALTAPVARAKAASVDFDEVFPRKSKKGLWMGAAVVILGAAGVGIWVTSSKESDKPAAAIPVVQKPAEDKASAIPPPPPETTAAPPPAPPPPPPATVAAPVPPAPPAPQPVAPPPVPQPSPPAPAAHVASAPKAATTPAPRPAPRPKGPGQTIVRDVPF